MRRATAHGGIQPDAERFDEMREAICTAITRTIADLGYTGFVGQEFIPSHEPLVSLEQGVRICTV